MGIEEIHGSSETDGIPQILDGEEVEYGVYGVEGPNPFNDALGFYGISDLDESEMFTGLGPEADRILTELIKESAMHDGMVAIEPESLARSIADINDEALQYTDEEPEKGDTKKVMAFVREMMEPIVELARIIPFKRILEEMISFHGESCHVKNRVIQNVLLLKVVGLLDKMQDKGFITRRQLALKSGRKVNVVFLSPNFIKGLLARRRERV